MPLDISTTLKDATKVRDPVCGMLIDPARAAGKSEYQGQTYYFCHPGCLKKFEANPAAYLEPEPEGLPIVALATLTNEATRSTEPSGTVYTCPMHPEIMRGSAG